MRTMNALVSVIIPVYKVEQYLNQCVDSIINQTYKTLEIILVDDASPDSCGAICDQYAMLDERVVVIHKDNEGQGVARNIAMDIARGDVYAFVDSDDWLELNAIELLMDFMNSNNLDAVFMGVNVIESGIITRRVNTYFPDKTIIDAQTITKLSLVDTIGGQPCFRICRSHMWERVRFPMKRIYEDLAISYQPFAKAKRKIGFRDVPLYNYRMNSNSTSHTFKPYKNFHIYLGFKEHYEYAVQNLPSSVDECLAKAAMFALGALHASLFYAWDSVEEDKENVRSFLKKNKDAIKTSKGLNCKYKMRFALYYSSEKIYEFVAKTLHQLKLARMALTGKVSRRVQKCHML